MVRTKITKIWWVGGDSGIAHWNFPVLAVILSEGFTCPMVWAVDKDTVPSVHWHDTIWPLSTVRCVPCHKYARHSANGQSVEIETGLSIPISALYIVWRFNRFGHGGYLQFVCNRSFGTFAFWRLYGGLRLVGPPSKTGRTSFSSASTRLVSCDMNGPCS